MADRRTGDEWFRVKWFPTTSKPPRKAAQGAKRAGRKRIGRLKSGPAARTTPADEPTHGIYSRADVRGLRRAAIHDTILAEKLARLKREVARLADECISGLSGYWDHNGVIPKLKRIKEVLDE